MFSQTYVSTLSSSLSKWSSNKYFHYFFLKNHYKKGFNFWSGTLQWWVVVFESFSNLSCTYFLFSNTLNYGKGYTFIICSLSIKTYVLFLHYIVNLCIFHVKCIWFYIQGPRGFMGTRGRYGPMGSPVSMIAVKYHSVSTYWRFYSFKV